MQDHPWEFKNYDVSEASKLQQLLQLNPVFTQLLAQRGLKNLEAVQQFLRPNLKQLYDPFLLKDMSLAVACIQASINRGERLLLFGDYDTDGLCALALLYRFLNSFYDKVSWALPNRLAEGYGLSDRAIQEAIRQEVGLIICLDCGTKDYLNIAKARKAGIAVIIVDHHVPGPNLPMASAILNPKQKACIYPFKELSACGVAFKLATALAQQYQWSFENTVLIYIDLVAVSIAADFVTMRGENRVLAFLGLAKLNSEPSLGLKLLLNETASKTAEVDVNRIVFYVAPVLNAAGRLGKAEIALSLLLEDSVDDAKNSLNILKQLNTKRKKIQADFQSDIAQMVSADPAIFDEQFLMLYQADWHPGLLGVLAAKMAQKHQKPCLVCCYHRGRIYGSARSVDGLDLQQFFNGIASDSLQSGGHAQAVGLCFCPSELCNIRKGILEQARQRLNRLNVVPKQAVDAVLDLQDIDTGFWANLQQFAPFGPGNKRPVFAIEQVRETYGNRLLSQAHIKFCLKGKGHKSLNAIAFNQYQYWEKLAKASSFDFCFVLEQHSYKQVRQLQLRVKDMYFRAAYC